MWEKIKEFIFDLAATGLFIAVLVTFILIIIFGYAPLVKEPWHWLLYLETGMCVVFIIWGIERFIKDLKG